MVSRGLPRRAFLQLLGGTGAGLFLGGCDGQSVEDFFAGGGGGQNGGAPAAGLTTGRVDLSQIGGTGLRVLSAFLAPANVDGTGQFATSVLNTRAQALLVLDDAGKVRALGLSLPGANLLFDAASTALTWVFLSPGLVVTEPNAAATLVQRIRALPEFQPVVDYLAARLQQLTLSELVADPGLNSLMLALVRALLAAPVQRTQAEEDAFNRDGRVAVARKEPNPGSPNTPFELSNEGWRFVNVIRQEILPNGQENITPLTPIRPELVGAVQVERNLLPGVSGFSLGNLFTAQTLSPGTAIDFANIDTPALGRLVYWIYGPGSGLRSSDPLPPTIALGDFGGASLGMTGLFYMLFPIVESFMAGLGRLKEAPTTTGDLQAGIKLAEKLWAGATQSVNLTGLQLALSTGQEANILAAWIDLVSALAQLVVGGLAVALEGTVAGTVAIVLELLLAAIGTFFAGWNALVATAHFLGLPQVAAVQVPIARRSLNLVGTSPFTTQDLDANGRVLFFTPSPARVQVKDLEANPVDLTPILNATFNGVMDNHGLVVANRGPNGVSLLQVDVAQVFPVIPPAQAVAGSPAARLISDSGWIYGDFRISDPPNVDRVEIWGSDGGVDMDGNIPSQSLGIIAQIEAESGRMVSRGTGIQLTGVNSLGEFVGFASLVGPPAGVVNFRYSPNVGLTSFEVTDVPAGLVGPRYLGINLAGHILVQEDAPGGVQRGRIIGGPTLSTVGNHTVMGLNDDDVVVGLMEFPDVRPVVWRNGGFEEINQLIPPGQRDPQSPFYFEPGLSAGRALFKGNFVVLRRTLLDRDEIFVLGLG
ncbi:MAG: hypothetical protein AB7S38_01760 [Vulcanimicrobiota bacterium]